MADTGIRQKSLRGHAYGMIAVLVLIYLLGMFSALFVTFPEHAQRQQLWAFALHQMPLAGHIILGFLLLLGTIALLIRSIVMKDKKWIISSAIATIAVIVGVGAGSSFITTQSNGLSFLMATSFIVAFLSYGWGIYVSR